MKLNPFRLKALAQPWPTAHHPDAPLREPFGYAFPFRGESSFGVLSLVAPRKGSRKNRRPLGEHS
jgi:hypothetical protein